MPTTAISTMNNNDNDSTDGFLTIVRHHPHFFPHQTSPVSPGMPWDAVGCPQVAKPTGGVAIMDLGSKFGTHLDGRSRNGGGQRRVEGAWWKMVMLHDGMVMMVTMISNHISYQR